MHNAAYRELGLDALYVPFEVEHFGDFWLEVVEGELLARMGIPLTGLSITSPHKEVAFAVAGAASPLANRLQAANTLVLHRGVWEAESTDGEGVLGPLRERGFEVRGRAAVVVGCGGAGRAAALALDHAGAEVVLVNRSVDRGRVAARLLGLQFVPLADADLSRFEVVVNATSVGRQAVDESPFDVAALPDGAAVVDLVYGEVPTKLMASARARGLLSIDGREVLLQQARTQFGIFTGQELPVEMARRELGLEASE